VLVEHVNRQNGTERKNDFHANARMRGLDTDAVCAAGKRRRDAFRRRAEEFVPWPVPSRSQRLHSSQDNGRGQWVAFGDLCPRKDGPGALEHSSRQIMHRVREMAQRTPQLHAGRSGSRLVPGIDGQVQTNLIETGSRGTWPGQSRPLFLAEGGLYRGLFDTSWPGLTPPSCWMRGSSPRMTS
jgi:hypothetical protein